MGDLLKGGRSKNDSFGLTALKVVENWVLNAKFNRNTAGSFSSKYTEKGLMMEGQSIELAADVLGWFMAEKNEQYFENDYFTGTPDILLPDTVVDIKSSWGLSSFPFFSDSLPSPEYFAQLQIYMALTGKTKAQLVYVLSDAPDHLIEREAFSRARIAGLEDVPQDLFEMVCREMTFSDIPKENRVKCYSFDFDAEFVENCQNRVVEAREIANALFAKL
jgi:hypothetical protein